MNRTFVEKYRILFGFLICILFTLVFVGFGLFKNVDNVISDKLFLVEGSTSHVVLVQIDEATLQSLGGWPLDRKYYAEFLNKVNAKVIGIDISFFDQKQGDDTFQNAQNKENVVLASEILEDGTVKKPVFNAKTGYVNLYPDADGIVRTLPSEDGSFSQVICTEYTGSVCAVQNLITKYHGFENDFEHYKLEDIVLGDKMYNFPDSIVLLGVGVSNLHDYVATPVTSTMYGYVYQANLIESYLENDFISEINYLLYSFVLVVVLFGFGYFFRRPVYTVLISIVLLIVTFFLSIYLFTHNMMLSLFYPVITILASQFFYFFFEYYFQGKEKHRIKHLFGKYVSKNVVEHMLQDPEKYAKFNAERKRITILFGDIRGFTKMSSGMEPEEVVEQLNLYLEDMTKIIFKYGGTLDKYVGDEVMAVFNSPTDVPGHEQKAFDCAKEMQKHIIEMNKKTGRELYYGIGINTGYAVVGSFGSSARLEFGVLGDTINVGARFCGAAKPKNIVIGQATYDGLQMKDKMECTQEEFELKGKGKVKAYVFEYK